LYILFKYLCVTRIFLSATKFAYSLMFLPFKNLFYGLPNSCGSLFLNVDNGATLIRFVTIAIFVLILGNLFVF
jgi:hypothetical protein